jgi:hypothetical protein
MGFLKQEFTMTKNAIFSTVGTSLF